MLTSVNLSNNYLQTLPEELFHDSPNVKELYLQDNRLVTVFPDTLLSCASQLRILQISHNNLTTLSIQILESFHALEQLHLSANPWECQCVNPLIVFAVSNAARITDSSTLQCSNGQPINFTTLADLCSWTSLILLGSAVAVTAIVCLLCVLFYMRYTLEIKVWLFKHNLLQCFVTEEQLDADKRYDAFISYPYKDEDFITEKLLPRLESKELNFRICWHMRYFHPGEMISTQITNAISESRRTIIVLSRNFLESVWGRMEFNTVYMLSFVDISNRIIPIIYQEIGAIDQLDLLGRSVVLGQAALRHAS